MTDGILKKLAKRYGLKTVRVQCSKGKETKKNHTLINKIMQRTGT